MGFNSGFKGLMNHWVYKICVAFLDWCSDSHFDERKLLIVTRNYLVPCFYFYFFLNLYIKLFLPYFRYACFVIASVFFLSFLPYFSLKAVSYSFTGKYFHFTNLLLWWWCIINAKRIIFMLKREIFPIYSRVEKNKKKKLAHMLSTFQQTQQTYLNTLRAGEADLRFF